MPTLLRRTSAAPLDTTPEPTVADRYNSASAVASEARNAFLVAALDLEDSARDLDAVLYDIESQIDELIELRAHVEFDAEANRSAAKRLRELVEQPAELTLF